MGVGGAGISFQAVPIDFWGFSSPEPAKTSWGKSAERLLLPAPCAGTREERDGDRQPEPRGHFLPVSLHGEDSYTPVRARRKLKSSCFCSLVGFWQSICLGIVKQSFLSDSCPAVRERWAEGSCKQKYGRERLVLPSDTFGFEDITLTHLCSWVEHVQANHELLLRLSPSARVKGAGRGAGSLKDVSRAVQPSSGDALLCPSYWCIGCLGRFLLAVLVFPSGASIPLYPHLPSCLTEEIWVRSEWSSCHGSPWDRVP